MLKFLSSIWSLMLGVDSSHTPWKQYTHWCDHRHKWTNLVKSPGGSYIQGTYFELFHSASKSSCALLFTRHAILTLYFPLNSMLKICRCDIDIKILLVKLTLDQVVAWCHQAIGNYLNHKRSSFTMLHSVTKPQRIQSIFGWKSWGINSVTLKHYTSQCTFWFPSS